MHKRSNRSDRGLHLRTASSRIQLFAVGSIAGEKSLDSSRLLGFGPGSSSTTEKEALRLVPFGGFKFSNGPCFGPACMFEPSASSSSLGLPSHSSFRTFGHSTADTSCSKPTDKHRKSPIFIEACAGCAILNATAKARGFPVFPIDCSRNHKTHCSVFALDLATPHALKVLRQVCTDFEVVCVHIGLPCGTCSKARAFP